MSTTVQLRAGDRRPRHSADRAGTGGARCRARARTSAVAAGVLDASRRASVPPDGEAASTPAAGWPARDQPARRGILSGQRRNSGISRLEGANIRSALEPSMSADVPESIQALVDLLAEAGLVPERPRALLEDRAPQPSRLTRIESLLECVRDTNDTAYLSRRRELAFLANTLMAG